MNWVINPSGFFFFRTVSSLIHLVCNNEKDEMVLYVHREGDDQINKEIEM